MKMMGLLMILAGLFLAFVYPSFQNTTSGKELSTFMSYQRGAPWKPNEVVLDKAGNPFQLRLTGNFLPGSPYLDRALALDVSIRGPTGSALMETINISPEAGAMTRPVSKNGDGSVVLIANTSAFSISNSGTHIIKISTSGEVDFSLTSISVTVVGKAFVPDTLFRIPGIIMAVFGVILIFRSRKKKRHKSVSPAKPAAPPVKKKIRWGRNADLD